MVITFNKRELLEFSNFIIQESKLPRFFAIGEESMSEMIPLIDWCDFKRLKSRGSGQTLTENRRQSTTKDCWTVVDLRGENHEVWISATKPDYLPELAIITMEEFNNSVVYEDVPLMTKDEVHFWMESEKLGFLR